MKAVAMRANFQAAEGAGDERLPFAAEGLFFGDEPRDGAIQNERGEGFGEPERDAAVYLRDQIFCVCGQAFWNQHIGNPEIWRYGLGETEDIKARFRNVKRDRGGSCRFEKTIGVVLDQKQSVLPDDVRK